ncbi:MAG TPA: hypothetical protein VK698_39265 [Kofleriaceae bacterium]|nr:hypothetical protein [Kofleriaceae bacterium]
MSRISLSPSQLNDMGEAIRDRERTILAGAPQRPDYPPLPPCPECGAVAERVESMMELPSFGVYEQVVLIDLTPCGHRFKATLELDESP